MKLEVGSLSDIGRTRDHNEDFLGMFRPADPRLRRLKGELFLVADGIGGHQSGEVASRMAVEQIIPAYAGGPGQDIGADLVHAIEAANTAIYTVGQGQDRRWRMGSTLVGALVRDHDLFVVNVGDSRAYLVRGGRIEQISQDHSLVAEQIRMGLLDAEQAKSHDYRSAITRALGSKPEVRVDTFARTLQDGDIVVLCTDGLSGLVKDEEIARVVSGQPPARAVTSLVAMANARGGKDNITTIVIKAREESRSASKKGWWLAGLLAGAVLVLGILMTLIFVALGTGNPDLPRHSPVIAPIEVPGGQAPGERGAFARMLGYKDEQDVLFKMGLSPDQTWPPLKPTTIHVLLVGRVVRLEAGQPGWFNLDMGGKPYYVIGRPPGTDKTPAAGALVSVLGIVRDESQRQVEPLALDVSQSKWLGLGSEWKNWYNISQPNAPLLVYTVVSPYTVPETGDRDLGRNYGLGSGEAVAVYGPWDVVETKTTDRYVSLTALNQVFRLEAGIYKHVSPK